MNVSHFRSGSGEPLLLIHGFSGTRRNWDAVLPLLTQRFDVVAPTLAGHHQGEPLPEGIEPTVDALADALERQMDAAGLETAHLAGNSLGGWLALELARRGRARSVVCLSPAGGWERGSRAERKIRRLFTRNRKLSLRFEGLIDKAVRRPRLRRLILRDVMRRGDRLTPAEASALIHGSLGCTIYFELMGAILRDGVPTWFGELDAPVLVAWSEHDRILPHRSCSAGFGSIPNVELVTLREVGHTPMWDDPELVARTIADFAGRHAGVASQAAATGAP